MSRRPAGPVELAQLRRWLRAAKGRLTFASLARRASARGMPVSACTLRRALTAGLPSLYTVRAVARGAGADEEEAGRVWVAAEAAVRPRHVRKPAGYVPGRQITTRAGPAGGLISRSALHSALTGRRLPGEELLAAFAAACGAGEETTRALLAARARVVAGPAPRAWAGYPCGIVEQAAEQAKERRARDAAGRHWNRAEDEPDWYDEQLRQEEDAEHRRMAAWVDSLTDDELKELQQARNRAGAGRDLHAELTAHITQ
ncbi:hypothetical protein [Streptomyces erythrogriseus]|uniref:hypothetical protein n=1 Tax=Streptomyces erythrogriseus TaxID=284027 RepID=UPI0031F9BEDF